MAIELERWKNQEDLTSQNFNRRLLELETHFNSLVEKNTKLEEENTKLKELLDNKVDKKDRRSYRQLENIVQQNTDILEYVKKQTSSGYFQLFHNNKNTPDNTWDWAFAEMWYPNDTTMRLQLIKIFPPYSVAKNNFINGQWTGWVVV